MQVGIVDWDDKSMRQTHSAAFTYSHTPLGYPDYLDWHSMEWVNPKLRPIEGRQLVLCLCVTQVNNDYIITKRPFGDGFWSAASAAQLSWK